MILKSIELHRTALNCIEINWTILNEIYSIALDLFAYLNTIFHLYNETLKKYFDYLIITIFNLFTLIGTWNIKDKPPT